MKTFGQQGIPKWPYYQQDKEADRNYYTRRGHLIWRIYCLAVSNDVSNFIGAWGGVQYVLHGHGFELCLKEIFGTTAVRGKEQK
jgi:hypothetical protein